MAKFGQFKFSEAQFGQKVSVTKTRNRMYRTIPLGLSVKKSIGKSVIYRVRTGVNLGTEAKGSPIQDKYNYFVPSSINNSESEPGRRQWIAAVHKWTHDLTPAEKKAYNKRIYSGLHMSGYNLFMREAMKGLVDMYVDRGDPATYDFDKLDLTLDGNWHDLDLSSIIARGAKAVLVAGHLEGAAVDWKINFRKKGQSNEVNHSDMETIRANVTRHRSSIVSVDVNRVLEYNADNQAWSTLSLVIRGWWT